MYNNHEENIIDAKEIIKLLPSILSIYHATKIAKVLQSMIEDAEAAHKHIVELEKQLNEAFDIIEKSKDFSGCTCRTYHDLEKGNRELKGENKILKEALFFCYKDAQERINKVREEFYKNVGVDNE